MKNATVFHDIRTGDRIFLCIALPDINNMADAKESSRTAYDVERELATDATPQSIRDMIAEMESESGLKLTPSDILREMGV